METVNFQFFVFMYTVYGGILIGIVYDIYRVVKGRNNKERIITSIWDAIFLIFVLAIVFWAIFSSNYGQLRFYVFIGFLLGFYLYESLIGSLAYIILTWIKDGLIKLVNITNGIVILPFKLIYSFLWYPLSNALRRIKKMPKTIIDNNKKYFNLIIRRKQEK